MALMSLCDLAIVAEHAKFGLPEARVGVFAMQVLVYLRRMLHARHINELCLTGELIDAQKAKEIGIANEVVPYAELDARVEGLIDRLCQMSPVALRRGKYAIAAMEAMSFDEALAFAETQIAVASSTDDAREGLAAFNERRPPRWAAMAAIMMRERPYRRRSGAWGDSPTAIPQLLRADVDYLMMDYLAEVTMSLLARAKMKDANAGFPSDFVAYLKKPLPEIAKRKVKVVSNAGGVNPQGCRRALEAACANWPIRTVEGDDLMPKIETLARAASAKPHPVNWRPRL
jgi:hypothetical protein